MRRWQNHDRSSLQFRDPRDQGSHQAGAGAFLMLEFWMRIPERVVDWGTLWNQLRGPNLETS